MIRRLFDLILIVAIVAGGLMAWRSGRERAELLAEYRRLERKTGDMPIGDPTRPQIKAIPTGQPLHFAWRVYLPANYPARWQHNNGSGWSSDSKPKEIIVRVRFRENDQGTIEEHANFSGSSSQSNFGGPALAKWIHGRWDRIKVEQVGDGDVVALDPDRVNTVLRLTLPEDMEADGREALDEYSRSRFLPTLYELKLGEDRPKPADAPGS